MIDPEILSRSKINKISEQFVKRVTTPSDLMGILIAILEMANTHADALAKSITDKNDIESAKLLFDVSYLVDEFRDFGETEMLKDLKKIAN